MEIIPYKSKEYDLETIGQRQERFFRMEGSLNAKAVEIAERIGATVRGGDAFRDPRVHGEMGVKMGYGHENSCHKLKIAKDILFVKSGEIIATPHAELHDWWDTQGGAPRIPHDMNHYSLGWRGYR